MAVMFEFKKHSILDVWHGPEYISELLKLFCRGSPRDTRDCLIYAKVIIVFAPKLEFSSYSEVIHESTTLKLRKV